MRWDILSYLNYELEAHTEEIEYSGSPLPYLSIMIKTKINLERYNNAKFLLYT